MNGYFALFYTAYPYYFPHFLPIYQELKKRGYGVHFVLSDKQNNTLMENIAKKYNLDYSFGEENLFRLSADYVFFANHYEKAKDIKAKTVFLEHGIGTKSTGFYKILEYIDIYLVEGSYKYERLKRLYPHLKDKLKVVGFSKFDPIVNINEKQKHSIYKKFGFDHKKKTILYAPTFFPSSIEKMSNNFPGDFEDCNILIKAHYLTYERKQYKNQRKKLLKWGDFKNCVVVDVNEYDLVPLFTISDVLISDESSAMFEFASLNKPVISNRYFKLRLSYYIMPWKLKKRIDNQKDRYREILDNAYDYNETKKLVKEALLNPLKLESLRLKFSKELCGIIDGNVSNRIVNIMEEL